MFWRSFWVPWVPERVLFRFHSTFFHVFFEALRNATKQDSMTALRTFYKNRLKKLNDHVIHDWSAGQRCIGLSDQEMLKRYETIQGELLRQRVNREIALFRS